MAGTPDTPCRFSLSTSAQTCVPGNRTRLPVPSDSCLLLVDRELQLAHDLAQSLQRLFGFAPPAQDHEVVGIGYDARAETSLQPEHLPSQHEPAHVQIRQQW